MVTSQFLIWKHISRNPTMEYICLETLTITAGKKYSSVAPTVKNDYTSIVKDLQISLISVLT